MAEKVRVAWRWLYDLTPMEQEKVILPAEESADRYHIVRVGARDRVKDLVFGEMAPPTVEIGDRAAM